MTELLNRFRVAVAHAYQVKTGDPELVPMALSQACVEVLPIAGAGISLTDELRVPLGASDAVAARAERLQTTLGEGPCLSAAAAAEPLVADENAIASRWPMFHRELVVQTPYRSTVSVPLLARDGFTGLGALDLYLTEPEAVPEFFLSQVISAIAAPISSVLFDYDGIRANPNALPPWLNSASVTERMHVWIAVGILMEHAGVNNDDALASLRAHAFAKNESIDDTAARLMANELTPGSLVSPSEHLTASGRSEEVAQAPWLGAQWADLETVATSDHREKPEGSAH
ncbi:MAG TPA: ANTAR domain-containing protein [Propionibacteriaceae bacterium]